jgi:hypothetical protein
MGAGIYLRFYYCKKHLRASLSQCTFYLSFPSFFMKYSLPSLAIALSALIPTAFAGGEMSASVTTKAAVNAATTVPSTPVQNVAGTPTWIGNYRKTQTRATATATIAPVSSFIASCPEAEGDALKLLSLQMVGACPAQKISTRFRR